MKATFAVTLISRKETVNLNNMPITSELVCAPDMGGPGTWLSTKIASLPNPEEWKVTQFETTPKVGVLWFGLLIRLCIEDEFCIRCLRISSHTRMVLSNSWKALTKVRSAEQFALYASTVR